MVHVLLGNEVGLVRGAALDHDNSELVCVFEELVLDLAKLELENASELLFSVLVQNEVKPLILLDVCFHRHDAPVDFQVWLVRVLIAQIMKNVEEALSIFENYAFYGLVLVRHCHSEQPEYVLLEHDVLGPLLPHQVVNRQERPVRDQGQGHLAVLDDVEPREERHVVLHDLQVQFLHVDLARHQFVCLRKRELGWVEFELELLPVVGLEVEAVHRLLDVEHLERVIAD